MCIFMNLSLMIVEKIDFIFERVFLGSKFCLFLLVKMLKFVTGEKSELLCKRFEKVFFCLNEVHLKI